MNVLETRKLLKNGGLMVEDCAIIIKKINNRFGYGRN